VDEERLWALLAATDVCVCLRHPTMGETSGIAIRSLSLGRPLVVSDVGWFAELPDAVAAKVPTGEHEVSVLAETLGRLLADEAAREGMGSAARALAVGEHDVERVADAYAAALEDAAGGDTVREKVAAELAAAADEVGMAPEGAALGQVAAHLREIANGD
jgi:glycosyltransferase involved in cell wall biosynthesis